MTGILPLVTATAVGLLAMQPRTVWRQGAGPKSGAKSRQVAKGSVSEAKGPVGGVIDDPLPADYEHSGRELPGPVLQTARPAGGGGGSRDARPRGAVRRADPATAALPDVIAPVKHAATSKPVEETKPRDTRGDEPSRSEPAAGAKEPDKPKEPSPSPKKPPELAEKPKEQERTQAPTNAKSKSSAPPSLAKNDKNETKNKKVSAHGEPASPSDRRPERAKTSAAPSGMLLGLFASLGANIFLLWVAASQRSRYRALVRETFESELSAKHADDAEAHDNLPHWESVDDDPRTARATHANDQ
ncbi:MAG TPA: hypothetical protein VMV69_15620 [Pirellulales bacterium]|nr:hypothetical protein [Pirellulales bacterium]